ncbi:MAG: hypothetical protein NVSMB18_12440 [Acetobacteraceae bacterium]
MVRIVATSLIAFLMYLTPAHAALVRVVDTTYDFAGACGDCAGTAKAELVLRNYVPDSAIDKSNFVRFRYDGTDLLAEYTITNADLGSVGGMMPGTLPSPAQFYVFGAGEILQSFTGGGWCTGRSCAADFGANHLWSLESAAAIPEPISLALLAGPFCGVLLARRRA